MEETILNQELDILLKHNNDFIENINDDIGLIVTIFWPGRCFLLGVGNPYQNDTKDFSNILQQLNSMFDPNMQGEELGGFLVATTEVNLPLDLLRMVRPGKLSKRDCRDPSEKRLKVAQSIAQEMGWSNDVEKTNTISKHLTWSFVILCS